MEEKQEFEGWAILELMGHRSTLYRLVKRRVLPAFRLGSDIRFKPDHLDEWIRNKSR